MDVLEAIHTRRSIRRFLQDKPVPDDLLKQIVDAARWGPTACNRQGWRFIVIKNRKQIEKLAEAGSVYYLTRIPLPILVLYDRRTDNTTYQDHLQSASAAIQNMFLAAHSLGLGMVWCDNLPAKSDVKSIFKVPWNYDVIALLGFGYYNASDMPPPLPRKKTVEEIISYDVWQFPEKIPNQLDLKLRIKTFLRKCYHAVPIPIKKYLHPLAKKLEKKFDPKDIKSDVKEI